MTRLGTLNQVDHLHKGSPRHCVIHPNDCWLASRVKIHLAWQFQPNQTSFLNCTSIGGSLSSESRPGIHHGSWLQEEHREIWMDLKKRHFSPVEPSKIGVLQCFVGIFRTPWIDRSITKFPGPLLRSRVAAVAATVWQTFTAAGFVIRRWVCRKI